MAGDGSAQRKPLRSAEGSAERRQTRLRSSGPARPRPPTSEPVEPKRGRTPPRRSTRIAPCAHPSGSSEPRTSAAAGAGQGSARAWGDPEKKRSAAKCTFPGSPDRTRQRVRARRDPCPAPADRSRHRVSGGAGGGYVVDTRDPAWILLACHARRSRSASLLPFSPRTLPRSVTRCAGWTALAPSGFTST